MLGLSCFTLKIVFQKLCSEATKKCKEESLLMVSIQIHLFHRQELSLACSLHKLYIIYIYG